MARLPIFGTKPGRTTDVDIDGLARDVLGGRDLTTTSRGTATSVRGGEVTADVDRGQGGLWAGDVSRLWTTAPVTVPKAGAVTEIAVAALQRHRVLPHLDPSFRLTKGTVQHTVHATEQDGRRSIRTAEATFGQDVVVDVSGRADIPGDSLPMFGGGGRFRAVVGDGGQIVGVHGVWRDTQALDERDVLPVEQALERAGATGSKAVRVTGATLGYYSAPSFTGQDLLFPVYAVSAQIRDGESWVPGRVRLVPATDIGQVTAPERPEPRRNGHAPVPLPGLRDLVRPGAALPSGVSVSSSALSRAGVRPVDVLTRTPGGTLFVKPLLSGPQLSAVFEALRPRSFGTSWIGSFGGLGGSQANAQGFVDQMTAEGWQKRFNWGNQDAWKSDWTSNDDAYVDDVDLVFYTGHAGPDGWMLATGGNADWIHHSDVGAQPDNPSDLWGRNNLEWAVIAACGPLEDDLVNGGGNVFDRWRGAFDGLHLLMGYAAVTFDNTEEGHRFAKYARSGMSLMQAWFRTAQEIQPSNNGYSDPYGPKVSAAAMYVGNSAGNTANDHLWGHGSVGGDIRNSTYRGCTFSPC